MPSELSCCSKPAQILRTVNLFDCYDKTQQVLTIGRCSHDKCGHLVAELVWYDKKLKQFQRFKPKKKNIAKFILQCERDRYLDNIVEAKFGTYSNMSWKYQKNGNIYDFNDTKIVS